MVNRTEKTRVNLAFNECSSGFRRPYVHKCLVMQKHAPTIGFDMIRRLLMRITDIGMLLYWSVTVLMALSIISIPGEWLFKDYDDPRVMAWNWSFLPLDLLLSVSGLWALRLEKAGNQEWKIWATISLTLTMCAGLMAISYWVLVKDYDLGWWIPNLFLLLWPIPFLIGLARDA